MPEQWGTSKDVVSRARDKRYNLLSMGREIFGRVGREKGVAVSVAVGAPEFAEIPAVEASYRGGGTEPKITVHASGMTVDIYTGAGSEMIQTIIQTLRSC